MRPSLALFVVSAACVAPSDKGAGPTPTETPTPPTTSVTILPEPEPTDPDPGGDAARVQALVDGEAPLDEVLAEVAASGGWPVIDGTTAWFVAEGADVAVAGDFDEWVGTPMVVGAGFSWLQVEVGDAAGQRYKLVRGADWTADPWARSYEYDGYGEISFVDAPTDRARLDRWPGVGGADGIAPRELRVWVPAGEGPWPTLYAMDGQNLFDPYAIWGGWRLQDALATRPEVLVVGIDNTPDRFEDYTHVPDDVGYGGVIGGNGDAYAAYVDDIVRPLVEDRYGEAPTTGLMGSSLGGLISLVVAQDRPGRYDFVASLSGTLGWGRFTLDEETVEERWLRAPPPGVVVYVDSGGGPGGDGACVDVDGDGFSEDDPDSSDNYCETRQFADALAASGFEWEVDLFHWWEPGATHDEVSWSQRAPSVLDRFLSLQ